MDHCLICHAQGEIFPIKDLPMMRCPQCSFQWLRSKVLSDAHYHDNDSGISKDKLASRRRNVLDRIRTVRRHVSLDGVCDIGTGEGMFLQILREQGYEDCWGIEPGVDSIAYARSQELDVTEGTIENLPALLPRHALSVVTLFHVIEHLEDPAKDIRTIYDALPSGGYLVIETPDLQGYAARHDREEWELYYPEHLWYFDMRTLQKFLFDAGFVSVASGKRNFDQYNMSIVESLRRLGIHSRRIHPDDTVIASDMPFEFVQTKKQKQVSLSRSIFRSVLSCAVVVLGRLDYVWIIVQKPVSNGSFS